MWRKFRYGFRLKIDWALGKMSDKQSLSVQAEEILMEQIRTYPCLYNKSKMSYKERDVKRNAWSKVAEKLDLVQNDMYKCRSEKLAVHLQWQRIEELGQVFLPQKYTFWSVYHFSKWIGTLSKDVQATLGSTQK